jgi:chemotaxis protein methyltransferase CheR
MHEFGADAGVFEEISALMRGRIGITLNDSKHSLIGYRLAPRLQALGLDEFADYLALLESADGEGEMQVAVDLLTTNETYFFREPRHFELLETTLRARRPASYHVWSAACSFGDEAYSVAMLLADLARMGFIGTSWSVLATDVSDRVLRTAKAGVYPSDRLRLVAPERLKRYCLRGEGDAEGHAMIRPELRERVRLGWLNLSQPLGEIGTFDAIFLRNVLIYFDAASKRAIVDRVLGTLRPGGLFFLGTAEGRVPSETALELVAPGVFRRAE